MQKLDVEHSGAVCTGTKWRASHLGLACNGLTRSVDVSDRLTWTNRQMVRSADMSLDGVVSANVCRILRGVAMIRCGVGGRVCTR